MRAWQALTYNTDHEKDVSLRLITDHIRSVTFMISDGIMPTNEGRGYVLRRLLRRAARHGRMLGIEGKFLADLSKTVIEVSRDGYPELDEKTEFILQCDQSERKRTSTRPSIRGLAILADMEQEMAAKPVRRRSPVRMPSSCTIPTDSRWISRRRS